MANIITQLKITHAETSNQMQGLLTTGADNSAPKVFINRLRNYLEGVAAGTKNASIDVQVGEGALAAASGTITFTGAPTANDTCAINGVTFTAKASGATGNQFNIGGTVTISATNLAAAINASATAGIANVMTATSALGVVTMTCITKGYVGNSVPLTTSLTNTSVSAANFAGGVNATANVYHYGL